MPGAGSAKGGVSAENSGKLIMAPLQKIVVFVTRPFALGGYS